MTGYQCAKTILATTSARCNGGVAKCDCAKNFARNSPADLCMPEQNCWNQSGPSVTYDLDKPLEGVNIVEPTVPNMETINLI